MTTPNALVDRFVGAHGSSPAAGSGIASLLRCGSIAEFRAAAPLPKNSQEMIDNAVVRVGRQRLVIAEDLLAEGLVFPLPNWISVPTLTSHRIAEAGRAEVAMIPGRGERQIMQWTPYTLPIPCIWDDFSFGIRELGAAERNGTPIDTVHVEQATRNVNERVEDITINGGPTIDGNTIQGLLATTSTLTYAGSEAWDVAGHTGEEILTDFLGMIDVAMANKFYGPFNFYIPTLYGSKLNQDFKSATSGTILERLLAIEAGGRKVKIRVADKLPANRTLLIQMTSDVVDMIVGQTPVTVSWEVPPGWERQFLVLACLVPRVKTNSDGKFGIVAGNSV